MDSIKKEWWEGLKDPFEYIPASYSFAELIDTFPDSVPTAKRATKARIKTLEGEINALSDFRDIWSTDINKMHFSKQPGMVAYLDDLVDRIRAGYEKEIKKAQYQLEYLANLGKPKEEVRERDEITPERIYRARQFPIPELIEVRRGVALCLWHDDHKPSLKYYSKDNHVYCFAEGRSGDAIDVDMQQSGRTFQESVRHLAP